MIKLHKSPDTIYRRVSRKTSLNLQGQQKSLESRRQQYTRNQKEKPTMGRVLIITNTALGYGRCHCPR